MPQIQVLDSHVAELIAAGEVVERPASVVKELVENAIDAGSTNIHVSIERGGMASIRVVDNGCGIPRDELPLAFLRHATSKVRAADDLAQIGTLGFRGEALAAICAVSRVEIQTRVKDAVTGAVLRLEGGAPEEIEEVGAPEGTAITVRDLFYNTPARLKFMRKDSAETAAINGLIQHLALSRPDIAFRFDKDGVSAFQTPGDGKLLSAIYAAYGREFARSLIPVDGRGGDIRVSGYVTAPVFGRGSRAMQCFFLNGRFIKSQLLTAALEEAYRNQLLKGKFPGCVLSVTMPAHMVDVNVHPAKTEVKFSKEREVFQAAYHTILDELNAKGGPTKLPSTESVSAEGTAARKDGFFQSMDAKEYRARVASEADNVRLRAEPEADNARLRAEAGTDSVRLRAESGTDNVRLRAEAGTVRVSDGVRSYARPTFNDVRAPYGGEETPWPTVNRFADADELPRRTPDAAQTITPDTVRTVTPDDVQAVTSGEAQTITPDAVQVTPDDAQTVTPDTMRTVTPDDVQVTLDAVRNGTPDAPSNDADALTERAEPSGQETLLPEPRLSPWRMVGEALSTYIVCESAEGDVYLIDKHAAHERVNFDRLKAADAPVMRQTLLKAAAVELSNEDAALALENLEPLESLGFLCEDFGGHTLLVREIPSDFDPDDLTATLEQLMDDLRTGRNPEEQRDAMYRTMACKAAVKGGDANSPRELRALVDKVQSGEIRYCPHGRPVAVKLSRAEIEKLFKRI